MFTAFRSIFTGKGSLRTSCAQSSSLCTVGVCGTLLTLLHRAVFVGTTFAGF